MLAKSMVAMVFLLSLYWPPAAVQATSPEEAEWLLEGMPSSMWQGELDKMVQISLKCFEKAQSQTYWPPRYRDCCVRIYENECVERNYRIKHRYCILALASINGSQCMRPLQEPQQHCNLNIPQERRRLIDFSICLLASTKLLLERLNKGDERKSAEELYSDRIGQCCLRELSCRCYHSRFYLQCLSMVAVDPEIRHYCDCWKFSGFVMNIQKQMECNKDFIHGKCHFLPPHLVEEIKEYRDATSLSFWMVALTTGSIILFSVACSTYRFYCCRRRSAAHTGMVEITEDRILYPSTVGGSSSPVSSTSNQNISRTTTYVTKTTTNQSPNLKYHHVTTKSRLPPRRKTWSPNTASTSKDSWRSRYIFTTSDGGTLVVSNRTPSIQMMQMK